jgi:hypothetical protein
MSSNWAPPGPPSPYGYPGPPPGYPGPPPRRGNGGVIAAVVVGIVFVVLLVLAGGGILVWSLVQADEPSQAGAPAPARTSGGPEASGPQNRFDHPDFTIGFRYPRTLRRATVDINRSAGSTAVAQWAVAFPGTDSMILVTRYDLRQPVTADSLPGVLPEADKLFSGLAQQPLEGRATEVGGMPAIEYPSFELEEPSGARSELLVVFDGDKEYLVNCQSTSERRRELEAACDVVRSTLERR